MSNYFISPASGCLVVNQMPIEGETESGLFIPESAMIQPNMGWVVRSGRDCKTFRGDTVQFINGAINPIGKGFSIIPERFCHMMWRGNKTLTVKEMIVHDGWVLLEVPYFYSPENSSGLSVNHVNESETQNKLAIRYGKVIKTPSRAFNEKDPIVSTYFDKSDKVEIKKGDVVFFSKYVITSVLQQAYLFMSAFVGQDGKSYVIIPYKELICRNRSGEISPLNDYCIATKKTDPNDIGLLRPDNSPSARFIDRYIPIVDAGDLIAGEEVILGPAMKAITLEAEEFQTLPETLYYFKKYQALFSLNSNQSVTFNNPKQI